MPSVKAVALSHRAKLPGRRGLSEREARAATQAVPFAMNLVKVLLFRELDRENNDATLVRSRVLRTQKARPGMLPPFIIEQIRRREQEERRRRDQEQPRLELPVDAYRPAPRPKKDDDAERDSSIVILDLG